MKATKTKIVGLKELRENMDEYITKVKNGASFTIVRKSKPVFEIIPPENEDGGVWETVVDFTDIEPNGVSAKDVLRSLNRLNAQNR